MTRTIALAVAIALAAGTVHAQGTASGSPDLSVASVKMADGIRISKMIGANVFGEASSPLGTVDDLIMTADHRVALAIVAVGGLMGVGAKLVAVPIGQLQAGTDGKLVMPNATKESLLAMPSFTYNG